jgi:hypothetical protein
MMDKVHVYGTRKRFVVLGVTTVMAESPRAQGQVGSFVEDDEKRPSARWSGVTVRLRKMGTRSVSFGHAGHPWFDVWRWRIRWHRLRHPILSRRPSTLGVSHDGSNYAEPPQPAGPREDTRDGA